MVSKKNVEDQVTEHLKQAEHHVIGALKLLSGQSTPLRTLGYLQRLNRAQELITGLLAEELVRQRGPIKKIAKRKLVKR